MSIFAKFIAIEIGLHLPETKFWMLRDRGTLERVLIAGCVLSLLGLVTAVWVAINAVSHPNSMPTNLALATIVALCLVLGGQTIFSGFYFGILHLMTQRREFPRKRRGDVGGIERRADRRPAQS